QCSRSNIVELNDATSRSALASHIWKGSRDPRGSVVDRYLASRKLLLPNDAGEVIRYHPALKFDGEVVSAMVSLFRDIRTNEPCGIHRTFLDGAGRKLGRKMLGRVRGAAIKLDADEAVERGAHIGEGVETCLAAWLAGFRPVWVLGSAGGISAFPGVFRVGGSTGLCGGGDGGGDHYPGAIWWGRLGVTWGG